MTLRSEGCFAELAAEVKSLAGRRAIVEIVNTGNWGDALIHAGQAQFLREIGVRPWRFSIHRLLSMGRIKRAILANLLAPHGFVTGHGAYTDWYARPGQIARIARSFSRVLLMPSSFPMVPAFDRERVRIWRRDNLESKAVVPDAGFCHDLAFYLAPSRRPASRTRGFLFREDRESGDFAVPEQNVDLSAQGTHASCHEEFLDRVGAYEVILTNRLHVGIAGALLGREVHLFDSRSQKIRSVFESSIRPFYDTVHYHPEAPSPEVLKIV